MEKENGNSAGTKIDKKNTPVSVTTVWLILTVIILTTLVVISLLGFFKGESNKEISTWFIFGLIGAAISNLSSALVSHLAHRSEEIREENMVGKISNIFLEKTGEITKEVAAAVKQNNLVSGNRDEILRLLVNQSLVSCEIKRIRILAHESSTFAKFFTTYFLDKRFECTQLDILVHNPAIQDENDKKIAGWIELYTNTNTNTKIGTLRIRNPNGENRRSFYGMVIEFTHHHPIGLIGFYRPLPNNKVIPFSNSYGVFNENSILDVLDEYFEYYWGKADIVTEKYDNAKNDGKEKSD